MTSASLKVIVVNKLGLHARPATAFSELATQYASEILVVRTDTGQAADGKGVLSLLTLAAVEGTELEIRAIGDDAGEAVGELARLVKMSFGHDT